MRSRTFPAKALLATLCAMGAATGASATASWVIAGGGDKPNRDLWVVDEASISDSSDLVGFLQTSTQDQQSAYLKQMRRKGKLKEGEVRAGPDPQFDIRVDEVFESAAKPNRIMAKYRVNCARGTVGVQHGQVQWRDRRPEDLSEKAGHAPASFGESQLVKFVCNRGKDARDRNPAKTSPQLGFLFIGETGMSPTDFIWQHLWDDGKRPAFTYKPSAAELDAIEKRLENNLARGTALAGQVIDSHQRSANRSGRNTLMETWIGKAERDFTGSWGAPDRFVDAYGGVRTLYYRKGYVNRGSNVYGQVLSEDYHWCDVTVEVQNGVIRDYSTSGNECTQLIR
ncbi:hypothetical protein [Novosphingobium sp.]|jgi:hypothetical protein|uniref:hypothetical protein n=1 Tax=Novosphingobium sp. TaxID=1874826 RepID=UPI002FE3BF54